MSDNHRGANAPSSPTPALDADGAQNLALVEESVRTLALGPEPMFIPGVPRRPQEIYRRLVRNNLESILLQAVPIARTHFGNDVIAKLFFRVIDAAPPTTRLIRDVPFELASVILAREDDASLEIPHPALPELLHFETAEIDVIHAPSSTRASVPSSISDTHSVVLDPSARILAYRYDVHRMKKGDAPPNAMRTTPVLLGLWRVDERMKWRELKTLDVAMLTKAAEGKSMRAIALEISVERNAPLDVAYVRSQFVTFHARGFVAAFVDGEEP